MLQLLSPEISTQIRDAPILIVDDNQTNRAFLEEILRARGFTSLLSVASGEEAIKQIDKFQPELVLLDIMMPNGMNGYDCCAFIRQQKKYADLPVLVQTALTEPALRVRAFQKGATDFVSKPVDPDELCARIKVHLEKRHALRSLQIYKNRISMEMESARQLQLSILPNSKEILQAAQSRQIAIASTFLPCSEVGGDFWGLKILSPHQTSLWSVDFSGHGMASALNAFRLQAYLKEPSYLAERPGDYLSHLNSKLLQLLLRGQFATIFYGVLDTHNGQLFYACANTPHPLIRRKSTGRVEKIDGSGIPLGIGMHNYATQTERFSFGDMLVIYSDAFTETPNIAGDYITEQQIIGLLEKYPDASCSITTDILMEFFHEHAAGPLRDDFTLIVCSRQIS